MDTEKPLGRKYSYLAQERDFLECLVELRNSGKFHSLTAICHSPRTHVHLYMPCPQNRIFFSPTQLSAPSILFCCSPSPPLWLPWSSFKLNRQKHQHQRCGLTYRITSTYFSRLSNFQSSTWRQGSTKLLQRLQLLLHIHFLFRTAHKW